MAITVVDDVLLRILHFCSIPDILRISETCRHVHSLAFSKHVWLSIIRDLVARLYLDFTLTQHLESLSTVSLITLVKRTVHGPTSWSPKSDSPPQVVATHQLSFPDLAPALFSLEDYPPTSPRLLRGGKYVVLNIKIKFICWSIEQDRSVWEHEYLCFGETVRYKTRVTEFAAEVCKEGSSIIMMVCAGMPGRKSVEILHLDLLTNEIESLITGNLGVVTTSCRGHVGKVNMLLIDFCARSTIKIKRRSSQPLDIACLPNHIVVLRDLKIGHKPDRIHSACLEIWGFETLMNHWRVHGSTHNLPPSLFSDIFDYPVDRARRKLSVVTYTSPLDDLVHTIWVQICMTPHSNDPGTFASTSTGIRRYQLSLDPSCRLASAQCLLSRSVHSPRFEDTLLEDVSYAGKLLWNASPSSSSCIINICSAGDIEEGAYGEKAIIRIWL
ncbi:hypothetical protein Hypma_005909 [Hypsizygus marmoreus]|uniref:F-box domain-containing protein n=1 Tax=Hypsizygus marmoreus TaxID=39966 RepID=A0A369KFY5_HYPMA|nr:hypothetical protein Hypma_005909 [Hypsizygus marmoreus]